MAWSVSGNVVIACNCDYGCPCNFNALPSHGTCEGGRVIIGNAYGARTIAVAAPFCDPSVLP